MHCTVCLVPGVIRAVVNDVLAHELYVGVGSPISAWGQRLCFPAALVAHASRSHSVSLLVYVVTYKLYIAQVVDTLGSRVGATPARTRTRALATQASRVVATQGSRAGEGIRDSKVDTPASKVVGIPDNKVEDIQDSKVEGILDNKVATRDSKGAAIRASKVLHAVLPCRHSTDPLLCQCTHQAHARES